RNLTWASYRLHRHAHHRHADARDAETQSEAWSSDIVCLRRDGICARAGECQLGYCRERYTSSLFMALTTLIVDDEQLARDELAYLLKSVEGVDIVAQGKNGVEAVSLIKEHEPDL